VRREKIDCPKAFLNGGYSSTFPGAIILFSASEWKSSMLFLAGPRTLSYLRTSTKSLNMGNGTHKNCCTDFLFSFGTIFATICVFYGIIIDKYSHVLPYEGETYGFAHTVSKQQVRLHKQ